ncbi:hypothetical protein BCR42DRAFT_429509 [Absidia repens]|uniref:Uncharacterized protein n=1 Tax=Absidia repens TaxID=90262 RepID=A0A1X2HWW6_9FUNG|nr:hypothetical protein BCR42DRAFT_429509 [Absidia repens]
MENYISVTKRFVLLPRFLKSIQLQHMPNTVYSVSLHGNPKSFKEATVFDNRWNFWWGSSRIGLRVCG